MDCDEVRDRLLDYRERQLDLPRRTSLEAHLLVCERCLAELRDLEALLAALATTRVPEPSPVAIPRLRALIAAERGSAGPGRPRWTWGPLAPAAAALLVVAWAAVWPGLPSPRGSEGQVTRGARAGTELERSIASMALSIDGSSMEAAIGLWQAPLPEREVLDAFVGLPESEVEELLARIRG